MHHTQKIQISRNLPHGTCPSDEGRRPDRSKTFDLGKKIQDQKNMSKNVIDVHISLNVFSKDIPGMYGSLRDALNVISAKHTRDTGNSTRGPLSQ